MTRVRKGELARYLVCHPFAALPLARAGWRLRRRGWWHHAPFLPLVPRAYWLFRVATARGDDSEVLSVDEMVQAARWSVRLRVGR
jgi:hypothetical protein